MDRQHAIARAHEIWGNHRYRLEQLGAGWWVWWGRQHKYHYIDGDGHTHCHKDCALRERAYAADKPRGL